MKSVVIGTAGHIDHGKSALVRALTGTDPDRLKEEKARGITIDLGFAHLELDGLTLAFVDVPGHERFVRNMLAGAGGIDVVMLVVAADESVMPQTREHFQICRLLRVPAGLIVLTKYDLADADMRELARMEIKDLVAGSFLDDAPIVEVSSKTGKGLDQLRDVLSRTAVALPGRSAQGPARLPVDRVFSVKGFGTVVTGTLVSGSVAVEDSLEVLPRGRTVKVRGVQVHGKGAASASAGHRVALNLGGAEAGQVERGDTLSSPGALQPTRRIDALLDVLPEARPIRHGSRVRFHQGTTEVLGRVAVAARREAGPTSEIGAGASGFARIRFERPAVLTRGDRFILRAYSPTITIGGGVTLDPHPARGAIRTSAGLARFEKLAAGMGASPDAAIEAFLEERQEGGLAMTALAARAGLTAEQTRAAAARLVTRGRALVIEAHVIAREPVERLRTRLIAAVEAHHAAEPLSEGLSREEARERIFGRAAAPVFEHVVATLVQEGRMAGRDRLSLAGRQVTLSEEEAHVHTALDRLYREAGLAPPDLASAASAAGMPLATAERMSRLMLKQKSLVKIDTLLFHADVVAKLKDDVRALKAGGAATPKVDVGSFKEKYGISRKFAIPLLEYLDRERVTRRVGDARVVL